MTTYKHFLLPAVFLCLFLAVCNHLLHAFEPENKLLAVVRSDEDLAAVIFRRYT